jgi:hypothetical protein
MTNPSPTDFNFATPVTLTDDQNNYYKDKFSSLLMKAVTGDKNLFDEFCNNIYPFCDELYHLGKGKIFHNGESTDSMLINDVASTIAAYILPLYPTYVRKSLPLFEMVRKILNEKKFGSGRCLFITEIWHKTKRTEGIDIKSLLADQDTATWTVAALLKLRDGRFVQEVINSNLQSRLPKDVWSFWKKKVELYIERYGSNK